MTSRELKFAPLKLRQLPNPKSICSAGYTNTVWDPQKWGQKSSTVTILTPKIDLEPIGYMGPAKAHEPLTEK